MKTYFIRAVSGQVKVGITANIGQRLNTLRSSSPVSLKLIGSVECEGNEIEAEFLVRFAHLRLHGEWLRETTELVVAIRDILNREKSSPDALALLPSDPIARRRLVGRYLDRLVSNLPVPAQTKQPRQRSRNVELLRRSNGRLVV